MTLIVLDDGDRGQAKLFDDPRSRELLGHQRKFGVLMVCKNRALPPGLDALRVVPQLVADPAFPLEARRRAVEWLRRQGVAITVAPQ